MGSCRSIFAFARSEESRSRMDSLASEGGPQTESRALFWAVISTAGLRKQQEQIEDGFDCAGFLQSAVIAFFACLMGIADGLSLGSLLIPHDEEHKNLEHRHLGMSIGLLTSLAMNIVLSRGSKMKCNVGGMLLPTVPVLAEYFKYIGPEHPETVIVLIPLITMLFGATVIAAGKLHLGDVVEQCPFPVYAGFIAGSGAQLLEFALSMMFPGFRSFVDFQSWSGLFCIVGFTHTWLAVVCAVMVFLMPRIFSGLTAQRMVMITMLVQFICVYSYLYHRDMCCDDLDAARKQGWLFHASRPEIRFYELWENEMFWNFRRGTVKWDMLLSARTMSAYVQVSTLGLLTITKNVFAIGKVSKTEIDINWEIQLNGLACIASGCLGGAAGSAVMSYSATAHENGAGRAKYFSHWLILWSLLLFVYADYVVALVPTMIPASILFWLGMELLYPFTFRLYGACHTHEWVIITVMVGVDIVWGCSMMLGIGLLATFVATIRSSMQVDCVRKGFTLDSRLSDIKRPKSETMYLKANGRRTWVFKMDHGYLAFWAASQILRRVREKLEEVKELEPHDDAATWSERKGRQFLVFDFNRVTDLSVGVLAALMDIVELGREEQFTVIFVVPAVIRKKTFRANTKTNVLETIHFFHKYTKREGKRFLNIELECYDSDFSKKSSVEDGYAELWQPQADICDCGEYKKGYFMCQCGAYIRRDLMSTLESCEDSILFDYSSSTIDVDQCQSHPPSRTNTFDQSRNSLATRNSRNSEISVISQVGDAQWDWKKVKEVSETYVLSVHLDQGRVPDSHGRDETKAVIRDIEHTVRHCQGLDRNSFKEDLECVRVFLEVKKYNEDTAIYAGYTESEIWPSTASEASYFHHVGSDTESGVPPLVWLKDGEIDHFLLGDSGEEKRVERARISRETTGDQCVGPLDTARSFLAAISHIGKIKALRKSTVVMLTRENYTKLCLERPRTGLVLQCYLQTILLLNASRYAKQAEFYHHQILYTQAMIQKKNDEDT